MVDSLDLKSSGIYSRGGSSPPEATRFLMNKKKLNIIQNQNILITGGLGFVGSVLAEHLSKKNKITIIDNLFTGKLKNKSNNKNITYIISETSKINKISKIQKVKFQYIFHLGEYSRVEQSYDDIEKVVEFNTKPFFEILKFAKKNDSKFIYSGSSTRFASYTNSIDLSPYAWSKISNINLLKLFSKWYGFNYAITYFYNVYGDREIVNGKYATVIAKFIKMKKNKIDKLTITYPGTQKRNFTHVNDVISALELIALYGKGDGYGIGNNKSYSIIEIARLLKMKYEIGPKKLGNRMAGTLKTNKTKKLGWDCKFDLKDYLKNKII